MSEQVNFYEVLGVARDATAEQIKTEYRRLAKELHPDHHAGDAAKEHRFKVVTAAYEVLGNPDLRRAYDKKLADEARATEAQRFEEATLRAAEAARRSAQEFERAQRKVPFVPSPVSAAQSPGGGFPWGELFGGLATVGITALIFGGLTSGPSRWDPSVQRRRGPDGRFRRSRRSDRRRRVRRRVA